MAKVWTSSSTGSVGWCRCDSFRALRIGNQITGDPGGRLIVMGNYNTMVQGRKSWRGWLEWYPATPITWLWDTLSPRRRVSGYRIQILRIPHQQWFQEDFDILLELLRAGKIHPVVAERLPFSEARHAHELLESSAARGNSCSCPKPVRSTRTCCAMPAQRLSDT